MYKVGDSPLNFGQCCYQKRSPLRTADVVGIIVDSIARSTMAQRVDTKRTDETDNPLSRSHTVETS